MSPSGIALLKGGSIGHNIPVGQVDGITIEGGLYRAARGHALPPSGYLSAVQTTMEEIARVRKPFNVS